MAHFLDQVKLPSTIADKVNATAATIRRGGLGPRPKGQKPKNWSTEDDVKLPKMPPGMKPYLKKYGLSGPTMYYKDIYKKNESRMKSAARSIFGDSTDGLGAAGKVGREGKLSFGGDDDWNSFTLNRWTMGKIIQYSGYVMGVATARAGTHLGWEVAVKMASWKGLALGALVGISIPAATFAGVTYWGMRDVHEDIENAWQLNFGIGAAIGFTWQTGIEIHDRVLQPAADFSTGFGDATLKPVRLQYRWGKRAGTNIKQLWGEAQEFWPVLKPTGLLPW